MAVSNTYGSNRRSVIWLMVLMCAAALWLLTPLTADAAQVYDFVTKWDGTESTVTDSFLSPRGIAIDPGNGDVYVSNTNKGTVQKYDSSGAWLATWSASSGSGGLSFDYPNGIAVDSSGDVFVVDRDSNRVQKISSTGAYITSWGVYGSADGQFNDPHGLALDGAGNVYVMDTGNGRVQKFTNSGVFITKWGGVFSSARGIAADAAGNVYVANSGAGNVKKFDSTGKLLTTFGSFGAGVGELNTPRGIAVDGNGDVFVADSSNNRVQKFSPAGVFITSWGSSGAADGQFSDPRALAADGAGNVFVADTYNHRVQKFLSSDTVGPVSALLTPAYATDRSTSASFRLKWRASDNAGGSGVASYDIRYLDKNTSSPTWKVWKSGLTGQTIIFPGRAGHTYYFRVRAVDNAGNYGGWTAAKRTIVPLDDSFGVGVAGFAGLRSQVGYNYYMHTFKYTRRAGDRISFTAAHTRRLAVIGSSGRHRSKANVYVDGVFVKTIDPATIGTSRSNYRQVLFERTFSGSGRHTVVVENLATPGRPQFDIDAFASER